MLQIQCLLAAAAAGFTVMQWPAILQRTLLSSNTVHSILTSVQTYGTKTRAGVMTGRAR